MKLVFEPNSLIVVREPGDPKYYGVQNAAGESHLLYALKLKLNQMGYDFIKKHMYKDGHLVDELQQYLRSKNPKTGTNGIYCLYNDHWAINGLEKDYNAGKALLRIERV